MKNHVVKSLNFEGKKYWVWAMMTVNGSKISYYDIHDPNGNNITEHWYFKAIPDKKDLEWVLTR